MLVVDELQVHVHEHGVQDQGQLVPIDVQRALNKLFQVAENEGSQLNSVPTGNNCDLKHTYIVGTVLLNVPTTGMQNVP